MEYFYGCIPFNALGVGFLESFTYGNILGDVPRLSCEPHETLIFRIRKQGLIHLGIFSDTVTPIKGIQRSPIIPCSA